MSNRYVRGLVSMAAILLLLSGVVLFGIFDRQGMNKNKINNYVKYSIEDYIEISPVIFNDYGDVYSSINISKINIKKIDNELIKDFIRREDEIIGYTTDYYDEIKLNNNYSDINTVSSTIKNQINGTVLSIFHKVDFNLDENIFDDNKKSYISTYNIDLGTNKVLDNDDLLSKYNYSKRYIAEKLFNEEVMIGNGQIVIDKDTNISLTESDIIRRKEQYIDRIIEEFDNIIVMYIENGSLVLVYNNKDLKNVFFDNMFDTEIKFKYLK